MNLKTLCLAGLTALSMNALKAQEIKTTTDADTVTVLQQNIPVGTDTVQIEKETQVALSETLQTNEKDINKDISDSITIKQSPRYGRISINSAPYLSISSNILNNKPFIAAAGGRMKNGFYAEIEKGYNPESYKESGNYILPVIGYAKLLGNNNQRKIHPQVIGFGTQKEGFWDKESTLILPNIRFSYIGKDLSITARYSYAINPMNRYLDNSITQINTTKIMKNITTGLNVRYNNGVFATDPTVSTGIEIMHNDPIKIGNHIEGKVSVVGNLNLSKRINPQMNTATKDVFAIITTWNIK